MDGPTCLNIEMLFLAIFRPCFLLYRNAKQIFIGEHKIWGRMNLVIVKYSLLVWAGSQIQNTVSATTQLEHEWVVSVWLKIQSLIL